MTQYLFPEDENEDYKYIARNNSIAMIRPIGHNQFPIEVYTHDQWSEGYAIMDACNVGFVVLYLLEIMVGVIIYLKKRKGI